MESFRVWSLNDVAGDDWWVSTASPAEARRLVALHVEDARDANDERLFGCYPDDTESPPEGFIYSRLHGPIPIAMR